MHGRQEDRCRSKDQNKAIYRGNIRERVWIFKKEEERKMNKVILMGRLTRDPVIRYTGVNTDQTCIARYTMAVDRRGRKEERQQSADYISCVAFGKNV